MLGVPSTPSPPLVLGGVPCAIRTEGDGGQGVTTAFGETGPETTVNLVVPYDGARLVAKALLGYVSASGGNVTYYAPFSNPENPNEVCTSIGAWQGIKPVTLPSGWLVYDRVVMPARFSVPPWSPDGTTDPSGLPFTVTRVKVSAEVFSPPVGSYYYTAGTYNGKPVAESSVGIIRTRAEITITRVRMPVLPLGAMQDFSGVVNDGPITIGDKIYSKGTLLFTGGDPGEPFADPATGDRVWTITLQFLGNDSLDWNAYMDPNGEYQLINSRSDGTGSPPFAYRNYTALFGLRF